MNYKQPMSFTDVQKSERFLQENIKEINNEG